MPIITIQNLTKDFGAVRAVDDLSFDIEEGKVVGFLGPNGSGKTTTLRSLVGLVTPTSGTATIHGVPYAELTDPLSQIGVMLEAASHPARTARNHLRVLADWGFDACHDGPDTLVVTGTSQEAIGQLAFDNGVVLYQNAAESSNLEDVFFDLTSTPQMEVAA